MRSGWRAMRRIVAQARLQRPGVGHNGRMSASSPSARRLAWLLVGALVGLSTLLLLPRGRPAPATDAPREAANRTEDWGGSEDADAVTPSPAPGDAPRVAPAAPVRPSSMNRANRAVELGEDLHALATALLPAAEAGDAEAQYSLSRIIDTCAYELTRFPDKAALDRRREELLTRVVGLQGPAVAALDTERFEMCDGFREDPIERFGTRDDWFKRALAQGHPLAGIDALVNPNMDPERVARPGDQTELPKSMARARFIAGIRSGRPEALWASFALDSGELSIGGMWTASADAVAWLLVACRRGYACDRNARWRREGEAFGGQPVYQDPVDALLFDLPLNERDAARVRADEIAAALERGDIDAIMPDMLKDAPP